MPAREHVPIRHRMVGWFDIRQLVPTGIRTAISTVFGEFADRREAVASSRPFAPGALDPVCDYRRRADADGSFWFDFVADTGDGWNSTYAVARLLADPDLEVSGMPKRVGAPPLLLMGGDQVYPAADRDAYSERLLAPFEAAWLATPRPLGEVTPDVYAIPGNHDWYDGLSSFLGIFCARRLATPSNPARQGRRFGGRRTQQTRSYFALALPQDWWIWGVDVQLGGYIDQPQIDFFLHVADKWMAPGSRLIICTGNPEWANLDPKNPEARFRNFDYVSSLAGRVDKGHRLCAVLTGDSHHYARYTEGDCQYITAGGGGAFLHPTHTLRAHIPFQWDFPPPGAAATGKPYKRAFTLARDPATGEESLFPSRAQSRRLALGDLKFPFLNWTFGLVMGAMWMAFAWLLSFNAGSALRQKLASGSWVDAVVTYFGLIIASPLPVGLLALAAAGFYYFSDYKPRRWRIISGLLHAGAHFAVGTGLAIALARCLPEWGGDAPLVGLVLVGGWLLSGLIFGTYLLYSVLARDVHSNEAFSALSIEGYKNFLRMRIGDDGALTIYPIGLTSVPSDRGAVLTNPPLQPRLIETPIRVA